jgi:hypothetical protein
LLDALIDLCPRSCSLPYRTLLLLQGWSYAFCSLGFLLLRYKTLLVLLLGFLLRLQNLRLHFSKAKAVSGKHCGFQVLLPSLYQDLMWYRYLAGHEMKTITADVWDDELWGLSKAQNTSDKTKLYFYFGTNDHWVADETRDELIAARAATGQAGDEDKPTMEIDMHSTPHGFCISKSALRPRRSKYLIAVQNTTM